MSGGFFQYQQYILQDIAAEIDEIIETNDSTDTNSYGEDISYHLPPEILEKFKRTSHTLKQVAKMVQRVDWLLSGDDGEETFLERWQEDKCDL